MKINDLKNLKIGFIGAGRVGGSIAIWLKKSGIKICGIYDKDKNKAEFVAKVTSSSVFCSIENLLNKVDLIIFSISDDSFPDIIDVIQEYHPFKARYLIHTSGSLSSHIFDNINPSLLKYSIHPMKAIHSIDCSKNPFINTFFSGEGDSDLDEIISQIVTILGGKLIKINSDFKTKYHSACCFISNLINANLLAGEKLFKEIGMNDKEIKNAIKSLSLSVINNYIEKGFKDSLTGPIARGDIGVIERHLIALHNTDEQDLYKALTKYIQNELKSIKGI